ncbi:hypothetical protein HK101_005217, partial [Irineochytrium annulatum]
MAKKARAGSPSRKGGKAGGGKMSAKKAKAKEAEEAAALFRAQELKGLRTNYQNNCKKFIAEPVPAVAKRLDRSVQTMEDMDK